MKQRLETLQNQALRHVINIFKKVNIKTLKVETYILTTCSSEQATESSHTTQSNQRQNTEDSTSMQNHTCSFDRN